MTRPTYRPAESGAQPSALADAFVLFALAGLLYAGIRLAFAAPAVVLGPRISLAPRALPWYALLSLARMLSAYLLSLAFSLAYGYVAARDRAARSLMMPVLDVLQSVPILSFLPVVLLSLSSVLPGRLAAEIAAVVLIFTSQAWNMTFSFYQSVVTVPRELGEAAAVFRLRRFLRFRTVELSFAAIPLVWNSMMSWAGGWFFLMASEIYEVGDRDFRLPGLGSYLQTAASAGDRRAILLGLATLIAVIVLLDQLVWRPLATWSDRFKLESTAGEAIAGSWFLDFMARSRLLAAARRFVERRWLDRGEGERAAGRAAAVAPPIPALDAERGGLRGRPLLATTALLVAGALGYGGWRAADLLMRVPGEAWSRLALALAATFARVATALAIAVAWTVPVGVAIGSNRRLAARLQPLVQILASVPATALFPIVLVPLLRVPRGLDIAAVLLMLMGTQWYLLFNVIAGASAIPQDLRAMTDLLGLSRLERWRRLILPALFPFLVTGAITASGGAWNASVVAEHVEIAGKIEETRGVGSTIAAATAKGDFPLLLAGTLALVISVVLLNRLLWQRLYRVAEERYRLE